jgi:predicted S18 family serine protease
VRRKLAIISSLFIALAIIIAILFISLMPSISPDDIIISGIIKEDSNISKKYEAE